MKIKEKNAIIVEPVGEIAEACNSIHQPGGRRAKIILAMLCIAFMFDFIDRMIISSLLPFIKTEWGLSDSLLGSLTGIVSLCMALFVFPIAILVDRWSRRKMVSIMIMLWSLSTLACGFAKDFEHLIFARALTGIGQAAFTPAAMAIIAASFTHEMRARVTGVFDAFAPLGAGLGFLIGGYVGQLYGWRFAMELVALPGIIIAILFWFTPDYKTIPLAINDPNEPESFLVSLISAFKGLLKIRTLWFAYFAFAMNFALTTPVLVWLPSLFHRYLGVSQQKAGILSGGIAMLVLIGAPLGGFLADKWMKTRPNARMILPGITTCFAALLLLSALLLIQTFLFAPLIILFGIVSVVSIAPAAAAIQDVSPPGMRAMAYGINAIFVHLLGNSWSPVFVGWLSDIFGLNKSLLIIPLFGFMASILFFTGARWYQRDLGMIKKGESFAI